MKHWIRLRFCRNYPSFNSIGFISYRLPYHLNNLSEQLYHKSQTYSCIIKQPTSESFGPNSLELEDVPISEHLNGLRTCIENTPVESADDIQIGFDLNTKLIECTARLPLFTNDQLLDFMNLLIRIKFSSPSVFYRNETLKKVSKLLDDECKNRLSNRDLNIVLPMMEGLSAILEKRSVFIHDAIKLYYGKIHRSPLDMFIRFITVINKRKSWNLAPFNQYEFEYQLEKQFHHLNIEQITTLTEALIQLNKPIINFELKKTLLSYVNDNISTMQHRHLYTILNLFCSKASFTINMISSTADFLRLLRTMNDDFDAYPLECIALAGMLTTKFLVHEPEFLEKLYRRFLAEGNKAKKTTIDCVVYTLIFFNYHSSKTEENVYDRMFRQITNDKSLKDRYKYTKRYIRLISWFCSAGMYDYDTINEILNEEYLRKTCREKLRRFNLYPYPLVVDVNVQIECPDYKGHRLSAALREDLLRCYDWNLSNYNSLINCYTDPYQLTDDIQQYNCKYSIDLPYYNILKEISSKLNGIFNEEISYVGYVLPHMPRPNLLFCLNENNQVQNLEFLKKESSTLVDWNKLDFSYKWHVVTVLIRNTFLPDSEAVPLGIEITKIRLFQKLNFNVVAVVQDEWLSMSEEEKIMFCNQLIR